MTAREYLVQLQERQFGISGTPRSYDAEIRAQYLESMAAVEPALREQLAQNLAKRDALEAKYRAQLPSPYQSLQDYIRLVRAKEAVDATLVKVGQFQPRENVVLGSVESDRINALSQYWRQSSEHLIVFNRGLLLGLLATSNFTICALTRNPAIEDAGPGRTEPLDVVDNRMLANLAPRFRQVLEAISESRAPHPRLTIPLYPWPEKEIRWTKLEDAAMEFVFAHEYAHILLGHTSPPSREPVSEAHGGWGAEYEADSLALDFLVESWLNKLGEANPVMIAFAMQGACLFFNFVCHLERYSAEVRGRPGMLWSVSKSHPQTYVRWLRMVDKARSKTSPQWWSSAIAPQLSTLEQCLDLYYRSAINPGSPDSPAAFEWTFQRAAVETLARDRLVPAHLFIAMRCAQLCLSSGKTLDERAFPECARKADLELEAAGARPLREYRPPLPAVVRELGFLALSGSKTLGTETVGLVIGRLADAFLLDAQTRYPSPAKASSQATSAGPSAIGR